MEQIVFEVAVVGGAVGEPVVPFAVFSAVQKLAFIDCAIVPDLFSLPIRQIT